MFTDTHTHLYADAFGPDRDALIRKAVAAGITRFYLPNIDLESVESMHKVCDTFPGHCFPMMGLHPTSVGEDHADVMDKITGYLGSRKYFAIGEIGIDLYWDKTFARQQEAVFARQVQMALDHNLPIVIHTRESFEQVIGVLRSFGTLPRGIFHCFTGTADQAEQVLSLGSFKLGIGGVVTFKNAGLDKVVESIALEQLVLETDAPYLAPVPFRGKRNEPVYLLEVARKIAAIKNMSAQEVGEITTRNALSIFGEAG